jgi:hypothetical protein
MIPVSRAKVMVLLEVVCHRNNMHSGVLYK